MGQVSPKAQLLHLTVLWLWYLPNSIKSEVDLHNKVSLFPEEKQKSKTLCRHTDFHT